jgi:uncharacterized membrane protein
MLIPPLHPPATWWGASVSLAVPATLLMGVMLAVVSDGQGLSRAGKGAAARDTVAANRDQSGAALVTGILLGIGIVGFIDEAVFHQLLQWHNFYWDTSDTGRILSDGLFHVVSTLLLLWGTYRLWRGPAPHARVLLAGTLLGGGGFNAYDGIVQHIILHLHLVNEYVCAMPQSGDNSVFTCPHDIPFEVVWIGVGLALVGAGLALWRTRPVRRA